MPANNAINIIECFCGVLAICSCTASKLAASGESQLMLQTYAAAF